MADYYPLIARALEGLSDSGSDAREAVYDRARSALLGQLRNVQPPLSESAIETECGSLDEAIGKAERMAASQAGAGRALASDGHGFGTADRLEGVERNPPIRRGGRRNRSLLTAVALVAVIGPIAALAWLWRDRAAPVADTVPARPPATAPAPGAGEPKKPERIGSDPAPEPSPRPSRPDPAPTPTPTLPSPATGNPAPVPTPTQPEVTVAQRAALVEENPTDPQNSKVISGRAIWRLDTVNAGQGQPLETVIRTSIEIPDANVFLALTMRRNRDPTLPASHIMELEFRTAGTTPPRVITDVNAPLVRPDDTARGVPLAGLAVPVKENVFLIGLSDLRTDVERNSELILLRNWIEIPLKFSTGPRATIVFEKGVGGERVVSDAFKQWSQP